MPARYCGAAGVVIVTRATRDISVPSSTLVKMTVLST
jgi:hypothetical protein